MYLGIDIGGTEVKLGLLDEEGNILSRTQASVSYDHYQTPIIESVVKAMHGFVDENSCVLEGIGVSATGGIDTDTGTVIGIYSLLGSWLGTPIKARLEAELGIPTWVLNDANAAVLGEAFTGAARGMKDVVMVTLGTGVGGGVITGGQILLGNHGMAAELGHITLKKDGPLCSCGKHGCFETYASTRALCEKAMAETGEAYLNGKMIFERAEAGDPKYLEILDTWLSDVAEGISSLANVFNPELILIGGGVSAQEELLIKPLREKVMALLIPSLKRDLRLEAAQLKNDAGITGAVKYCIQRMR